VDTVNVDRVLAHGDNKFHVVLLNQVREKQWVRVSFDEKTLGRVVEGARLSVWRDNQHADPLTVKDGAVELELAPLEIAALTMDGVRIDVPTHRLAPAAHFSLPQEPGQHRAPIASSKLEAVGTALEAPPFEWRDLYVYLTAGLRSHGGWKRKCQTVCGSAARRQRSSGPPNEPAGKLFSSIPPEIQSREHAPGEGLWNVSK
jgi:hypothetical protein